MMHKDDDGNRHTRGGLPGDDAPDLDGNPDWNTMVQGGRQQDFTVAAMPPVCTACGTQPDPLTLGCRC